MTIGFVAIAIGLDTLLRERHRIAELAMIAVLAIGLWIVAAQHSAD
ncbi:hypothetical protein [Sphingomonas oligophenolica]|nr:hypothetical protein [Sphingomonas oligophenolica]